jgi:peptide/nickel transport system substrate-binding protein
VQPRLAQSVTPSADFTSWTMKLRDGVKFSDGTAFDATAVKSNWDRILQTQSAACRGDAQTMTQTVVTNRLTLQITLAAPNSQFPRTLTNCLGFISSPAAFAKGPIDNAPVGAGPFQLQQWVRGAQMVLTRNPSYWDSPKPYVDQVTFKPVTDNQQRASALMTGQADAVTFATPSTELTNLQQAGYPMYLVDQWGGQGAAFNMQKAPFDDVRVRTALRLAADPKNENLKVVGSDANVVSTLFPKGPFYDATLKFPTTNLAKAQKLIDAYVAEKGGPVKGTLTGSPAVQTWFTALQQDWAKLKNVDIQVEIVDGSVTLQRGNSHNFDMIIMGIAGLDPDDISTFIRTGASGNREQFSNPEVDALLLQGRNTAEAAKRKAIYAKVGKIFVEQAPIVYLYRNVIPTVTSKNVKDVNVFGQSYTDFATVRKK